MRRRRTDLLDVLLELRAAEQDGAALPPGDMDDPGKPVWNGPTRPRNATGMDSIGFGCRDRGCRQYIAIGQSRKGAEFFACVACSIVFTDPGNASKPRTS